jgi:effector-binding domain-containing protein
VLTLPKIVERAAQPYVAVREKVTIPFGPTIDRVMPEVVGWLQKHGVEQFGPAVFKYDFINMPDLEMEFGFAPTKPIRGDGRVAAGVLPAGKYATVAYWGHYDDLMDVTALLIGWAKQKGIVWDAKETPQGDTFTSRFELYPNGPMDEPDPAKWETQIFIKIKD